MIKPILFSTPMVQAILEGRKTMTRRIIKLPKDWVPEDDLWDWVALQDFYPEIFKKYSVGDVLWVRETWNQLMNYYYKATDSKWCDKWKPSIFMPKAACRIFLEITDVRIERLQDISGKDAVSEGVNARLPDNGIAQSEFHDLWAIINGAESWEANPFVWVIEFKQTEKPQNFN